MTTHTELVDCPRCGEPVTVEMEWNAAEMVNRDYEAAPAHWSVIGNSGCPAKCCLTPAQLDEVEETAMGWAMDMVREAAR